jgi:cbb3-type cytochrome oxidase subunit 3
MKIDELIERIKPKSRKELPFFLLKAAITILIVRELFYDISHVRFSEVGMVWLLVYITKVLVFVVVLYIIYRKVKKWQKNDRKLASYIF